MMHKMNALAHQCGENTAGVKMERWDAAERGKGSNTAITTQLISTGVTERISVTPSMFTQPGRGGVVQEGRRVRKEGAWLPVAVCTLLHVFFFRCLFICGTAFNSKKPSDLNLL